MLRCSSFSPPPFFVKSKISQRTENYHRPRILIVCETELPSPAAWDLEKQVDKIIRLNNEKVDTPCMLIDSDKVNRMLDYLSEYGKVYYPVKACAYLPLIELMVKKGLHFNINSLRYLHLAIKAGASTDSLLVDNCLFSGEEIDEAIFLGASMFAVDRLSMAEYILERVPRARLFLKISASVIDGKPHKYGIGKERAKSLYDRLFESGNLYGVSFYIGEDLFNQDNVQTMCEFALSLGEVKRINVGGGFTACTFLGDYFKKLATLGVEVIFEPGRGVLVDSCSMLTRVVTVDRNGTLSRLRVDASVYSGLMDRFIENKNYSFHIEGEPSEDYLVSGYTSDSCDCFGVVRLPKGLREGDLLTISNCGPYSFDMSSTYSGARPLSFKMV